jgi:hypothetical protein
MDGVDRAVESHQQRLPAAREHGDPGTGFRATAMYASLTLHPMVAPGTAYYLLTAGGILAALGIIIATFPLLARITGPEVARNE